MEPRDRKIRGRFQIQHYSRHARRCLCHADTLQQLVTNLCRKQSPTLDVGSRIDKIDEDPIGIPDTVGSVMDIACSLDGYARRVGQRPVANAY